VGSHQVIGSPICGSGMGSDRNDSNARVTTLLYFSRSISPQQNSVAKSSRRR